MQWGEQSGGGRVKAGCLSLGSLKSRVEARTWGLVGYWGVISGSRGDELGRTSPDCWDLL